MKADASTAQDGCGPPRRVALLGSTGTIGVNALEVVESAPSHFSAIALTCCQNTKLAIQQARKHRPLWLVAADPDAAERTDWSGLPPETELLVGPDAALKVVQHPDVDVVLGGIVGCAGLPGVWAALEAGKTVALANKESLVAAGPLMMDLCRARGGTLVPVDSEHSAIFQALQAGRRNEVARVILTASGGPFRAWSAERMKTITPADALKHPTWVMGAKTTIDSATMMNKALELIEARWLFDLDPKTQLEVAVHPQSVVHSMVEFIDGSVVAQLSPPDMKLPIQYALAYPNRIPGPAAKMDWGKSWQLQFEPPDHDRFPSLRLGLETAERGGSAGVVVNAANEEAVRRFLAGELEFMEIAPACRRVLENHDFDPSPSLEDLFRLDRWARQEVFRWICT